MSSESPQLPTFLTFGTLSILASFLTLLLPETWNRGLPDTVAQAKDLGKESEAGDDGGSSIGRCGSRKRKFRQQQQQQQSNDEDDKFDQVGYGKSPEWVEVGQGNTTLFNRS